MPPTIAELVDRWPKSPFGDLAAVAWAVTQHAQAHLSRALAMLADGYEIAGDVAVHRSAIVEAGAIVKGPAIIGPRCFVAATAYLRGGVFLDEACVVGPGAELKTSFMFKGAKLAHFDFVGDSILGSDVNLEAGSIVANYRNERKDKTLRIAWQDRLVDTHVEKFGALIGGGVRIGANAVIAPGAIIAKNAHIPRPTLLDQSPKGVTGEMLSDTLAIHPLTADRWADLEDLFGPQRGANSGCWCMWPRLSGVAFKAMAREDRRDAFHAIVAAGPPPGLLAYDGKLAVGWCAVGPRPSLARFQSAKTSRLVDDPGGELAEDEMPSIHAISCFFIRTGYRKRGLTRRLAMAAIEFARQRGAAAVDICAIEPQKKLTWGEGFVGIASVFASLGFREIARRSPHRPLMRLSLERP